MAKSKYAILDIQNDDDELQFQDFGLQDSAPPGLDGPTSRTEPTSQQPTEEGGGGQKGSFAFWSFGSYQALFDVDTRQVTDRLVWSMLPKPGVRYLHTYIRPQPDMYGPVWVCVTLVFTAAVAGNVSEYLQTAGTSQATWHYDFHKVTLAAALVLSYAWLLPALLWALLKHVLRRALRPSLLEAVCCYGYSLAVLVPVCAVWTVPVLWLRWCVGVVGVVLSGVVLSSSFFQAMTFRQAATIDVSGDGDDDETEVSGKNSKKVAFGVVAVVVVCHIAIAAMFMMHFFAMPPTGAVLSPVPPAPPVAPGPPTLPQAAALLQNPEKVRRTSEDSPNPPKDSANPPKDSANPPKDNANPPANPPLHTAPKPAAAGGAEPEPIEGGAKRQGVPDEPLKRAGGVVPVAAAGAEATEAAKKTGDKSSSKT